MFVLPHLPPENMYVPLHVCVPSRYAIMRSFHVCVPSMCASPIYVRPLYMYVSLSVSSLKWA